jgi:hypothetical protein
MLSILLLFALKLFANMSAAKTQATDLSVTRTDLKVASNFAPHYFIAMFFLVVPAPVVPALYAGS